MFDVCVHVDIPALDRLCNVIEKEHLRVYTAENESTVLEAVAECKGCGKAGNGPQDALAPKTTMRKGKAEKPVENEPAQPETPSTVVEPITADTPAVTTAEPREVVPSVAVFQMNATADEPEVTVENHEDEQSWEREVTIEEVMKAARLLCANDKSMHKHVTDTETGLFAEFEIKNISALKGDDVQRFAQKLRELGGDL